MDLWRVSFLPEQQFFEKQKVSLAVQYNTHSQDYESNAECGTGHQRPSDAILKDMKNENPRWVFKRPLKSMKKGCLTVYLRLK